MPGCLQTGVRSPRLRQCLHLAARWLLMTCAVSMFLFGVLKLASSPHARGMQDPDPLFYFIEVGTVLYAAGVVEICVAVLVLLQRAKNVGTAKLFLALTLAVSLYRFALTVLAPGSPCHCGGFGKIGLQLASTLPSYAFTGILVLSFMSSMGLLLFPQPEPRAVRTHVRMGPVAQLPLLMPLWWLLNPLLVSGVEPVMRPPRGTTDAFQVYGTGVLEVLVYNTNRVPLGSPVRYPLAAYLHDGLLIMTNGYPDGTGQWSLLRSNVVLQVAVSTTPTRSGHMSDTASSTPDAFAPRPSAATVFSTENSHGGLTPDALLWLALYGGAHAESNNYLKPPHLLGDEVVAWLTATTYSNLPPAPLPLLQSVTWQISLKDDDFKRAVGMLPRNEVVRVELRRASRPFPQYPAGLVCGTYLLLESNIIDGVVLPKKCEARGFIPQFELGKQVTNRLSSLRTLEIHWSRTGTLSIAENMELPFAVWFQDLRAAASGNGGRALFYKSSRLSVIPTNSPVYIEAVKQQLARVSSPSGRVALRVLMIGVIAAVLAAGVWSVRGSFRRKLTSCLPKSNG